MTETQFCYWLRGFFEILQAGPKTPEKLVLTAEQVEMIDKHLKSVFAERIMVSEPIKWPIPPAQPAPYFPGTTPGSGGTGVYPWPPVEPLRVTCEDQGPIPPPPPKDFQVRFC